MAEPRTHKRTEDRPSVSPPSFPASSCGRDDWFSETFSRDSEAGVVDMLPAHRGIRVGRCARCPKLMSSFIWRQTQRTQRKGCFTSSRPHRLNQQRGQGGVNTDRPLWAHTCTQLKNPAFDHPSPDESGDPADYACGTQPQRLNSGSLKETLGPLSPFADPVDCTDDVRYMASPGFRLNPGAVLP
jgi:hypothetical protein